jgi:dipeptidyl aminopeptidase/acylaminoacyl peptidase
MMKLKLSKACGPGLLCALALFLGVRASAHPFKVEDMQNLSRVGDVRISPDGRWAVFTVTRSDLAKNRAVTNLWRVPTAGGEPQQLTFAQQGSNNAPRWSADGRYLYCLSSRAEDKSQVFRLVSEGGEAKQITNFATGVSSFVLSPDGNTLAIVASVFPSCTDMACNEKLLKERKDNPVKARVITEMPFRRWDSWVDGLRNHIFVIPSSGGTATDLTPGDVDSPIWPGEDGG